tara:strand:+ start:1768 stop:2142 length:375 start_codon:yes stop_codon:yes gene_type:complete
MRKRFIALTALLLPLLLPAQALHQWAGSGTVDNQAFELKVILFEGNKVVILAKTQEAPIALEGTWESEDESVFELTITTESIMDQEKVPVREGKIFLINDDSAVILASGFGVELQRLDPQDEKK